MNILVAQQFFYPRGGDWTYVDNLMSLYKARGHHVIPFGMHHPENVRTEYDEYFVSQIDYAQLNERKTMRNAIRVIGKSIYSFEAKENIRRLIDHTKPDIAHLNNIHKHITPSIVFVLNECKIPIIWTMHAYNFLCPNDNFVSHGRICEACKPNRFYNCAVKRCKKNSVAASLVASLECYAHYFLKTANRIDMFIAPSGFLRDKFIEFGFDPDRFIHLPNFITLEGVEPSYANEGYILFYGRISSEKGLNTLLRAMARLPQVIKLKVVGRGPQLPEEKAFCRDNYITNVEFVRFKTGRDLAKIIAGAKFVVIPSECYEILPFTMVEAFCFGKPIVAPRIGEFARVVADHDVGILFELKDEVDLAEKIELMWNSDATVGAMGRRAREYAATHYDRDYHYKKLSEIISMIASARGLHWVV